MLNKYWGVPDPRRRPTAEHLRDVETQCIMGRLVVQTDDWTWSALLGWLGRDPLLRHGDTEVLNRTSSIQVNKPLSDGDLHRLRPSV
jgi:hypothetical protein